MSAALALDAATLDRDAPRAPSYVEATLTFIAPMAAKPFNYTFQPPDGGPMSNVVADQRRVRIHDVRPVASRMTLDTAGFALVRRPTALRDFDDEAAIRAVYYPESEAILRAATGAARVLIFDHTLRRRIDGAPDRGDGPRQPVARVHVDQTVASGPKRVRDLLPPDEAETLLRGRVRLVNLWRPILGPAIDMPLAVADARSVAPGDLIPSDLIFRDRVGETYAVRHNPAHRWYYAPHMGTYEALLLKCYDSATDGTARFVPHAAFADPTAPADAPPRQSIELRALLFG
ncbi:CmcJ/NvfI family oxidoreductase [Acidisphaera rubrifaciens]|uniref:Methyltransferase n=1 Tax=Acidisphaera rubrifaciens HS-AP3 TaxID=1231350 RepID=A0A0D6P947_9PROT|nr:CmcJ/NvfI family oxidoreductase [Acidisphaera rubrifaciens]GAN77718.1 hypothetical protein Asru_0428_04 [Acidisphaera rubrifaciens HS-AP3]